MADAAASIESLTDQQRLALEQYTAVTAQDVGDALPLLARCEWNVQVRCPLTSSGLCEY